MELIYKDKFFIFKCTYDERFTPKYAGFYWDSSKKVWKTNKFDAAVKLKVYADEKTEKAIDLFIENREENLRLSREKSVNLDFKIPTNKNLKLYPFQEVAVKYSLNKNNVLIADEMGLGKTIEAISIINVKKPKSVLIICPSTLKINWERELEKWLVDKYTIKIIDSKTDKYDADICIVNYARLWRSTLLKLNDNKQRRIYDSSKKFDMVIVDEAHKIKNNKAKRSKAVYIVVNEAKDKILLTGTPILNRPSELFNIVKLLGWKINWMKYMTRYADAKHNGWGWDINGASNLDELQTKLRSKFMVRREKEDVLTELPLKIRQIIRVNIENKRLIDSNENIMLKYGNLIDKKFDKNKSFYRNYEKNKKGGKGQIGALGEIAKVRHETALAKVPIIIKYIKDLLEVEDKIVVFAHHHDVIDEINKAFIENSVVLTGRNSKKEKQEAIDRFQKNNKINIMIGSIQAAGVGITLTAAKMAVFVELTFVPGEITQAEDRIHRIGQKNAVLIQHIVAKNSIDDYIVEKIISKQKIINEAIIDENKK